jgi:hypothetical protein
MSLADVRVPRARLIVAAATAVVCASLLFATHDFRFYFDEWALITAAPDWTLRSFFEPHNEHPAMLLKALYAALLNTAGLRTYVPYMAALLVAHAANVLLVFALVRRRAGDAVGIAAALLLLVLGAGWEDLLWAFQVGWLASIAFGLAALVVLPRRPWLAAALVAVSLAFTGVGIAFGVACVLQLALDPQRRTGLYWLAPVGIAFAAWYVAFGRFGAHPDPGPTVSNAYLAAPYVLWGLAQGVAGLAGLAGWVGVPLLALALAALGWRWRGGPDGFAVGVAAGLVAIYAVTGATRAQLGWQQAGSSRYVYLAAVLWLLLLADAAGRLPWRGTWRPALAACVFLACFNSAAVLVAYTAAKTVQMHRVLADLDALDEMRGDPCLDPGAQVDPLVMPYEGSPALYYRAVDRYGDPGTQPPPGDQSDYAMALLRLRQAHCVSSLNLNHGA